MNKLKLELEALQVESFEAVSAETLNPGTVRANEDSVEETVCNPTGNLSCQYGCGGTGHLSICGTCPRDETCGVVCVTTG